MPRVSNTLARLSTRSCNVTNAFALDNTTKAYSCRVRLGFRPISNNKISDETRSIFPDSSKARTPRTASASSTIRTWFLLSSGRCRLHVSRYIFTIGVYHYFAPMPSTTTVLQRICHAERSEASRLCWPRPFGVPFTGSEQALSYAKGSRPHKTEILRCAQNDIFNTLILEFLGIWASCSIIEFRVPGPCKAIRGIAAVGEPVRAGGRTEAPPVGFVGRAASGRNRLFFCHEIASLPGRPARARMYRA